MNKCEMKVRKTKTMDKKALITQIIEIKKWDPKKKEDDEDMNIDNIRFHLQTR